MRFLSVCLSVSWSIHWSVGPSARWMHRCLPIRLVIMTNGRKEQSETRARICQQTKAKLLYAKASFQLNFITNLRLLSESIFIVLTGGGQVFGFGLQWLRQQRQREQSAKQRGEETLSVKSEYRVVIKCVTEDLYCQNCQK